MPEKYTVAFGRYLRTLRERRQLSLDDVATLTRQSLDPVDKAYISRCENGHQKIAFAKMVALAAVYDVPLDVLGERLSLDMELDRIGGPETEGKSFEELTSIGATALHHGARWDAYACFRDALPLATNGSVLQGHRDFREQVLCAYMNFSTAAGGLGKTKLALHELEYIRAVGGLGPRYAPLLLERISVRYRLQGDLNKARNFADLAISEAERTESSSHLGYLYGARALVASQDGDFDQAVSLYQKAFKAFRDVGQRLECARTLSNLAQAYFNLRRYTSARRALEAAERMAAPLKSDRIRARVRILLGEIEELENRPEKAAALWREAVHLARELKDRVTQFKAEFLLYRQAITLGNRLTARALERRLQRMSPWISKDVVELNEFTKLAAHQTQRHPKRVSFLQHGSASASNP